MRMHPLFYLVLLGFLYSGYSFAGCTLNIKNEIHFGKYDPFAMQDNRSVGQINVACTEESTPFTLLLSPGNSRDYGQRFLRNGRSVLEYNLYLNPSRTLIWGNGTGNTVVASEKTCEKRICRFFVYGEIPAKQTGASAGKYTDTITATLAF